MNKILLSLLLAFFVQVKIPAGMSRSYDDVKHITFLPDGVTIQLTLKNDKIVFVPALFTVIEEK
jgi:hypothetical protein